MTLVIHPAPLSGTVTPPPSKSQAHRLLIAAALADGESVITNVALSQDIEATLRCLGELGVTDILEVGPGKALSGFVKKTLGADVHCTTVETAEELEAFLTSWKEAQA